MSRKIIVEKPSGCKAHLRAIHDTLDMVSGKWKVTIIGALSFGNKRFMELQREVEGIGSKMLSKELRELEQNELVIRTVYDTKPVTVEYELTDYGKTLENIIAEMAIWGAKHRAKILNKPFEPVEVHRISSVASKMDQAAHTV